MAGPETSELRRRIVDAAVALAEERSWEAVRLHDVAAQLGIGLDAIRQYFREKDELIDAWFDRADDAVLRLADSGKLEGVGPRERLFLLITAWLDALEPHRRVTRQMVLAKLEPGHLHIQFPALMRISRTVQWMREGASLQDAGWRRALTETAATAIYLSAFTRWLSEDTPGSPRTRRLLDRLLEHAEAIMQGCPFAAGQRSTAATGERGTEDAPPWTP